MKISSIEIKNFKSIKDYTLKLEELNINDIKAGIFVGLNESGKSSLLEAIHQINKGLEDIDYDTYCNLDVQDENEYLELYVTYDITENSKFIEKLKKSNKISDNILKKLNIKQIVRNIYKNNDNEPEDTIEIIFDDFDYHNFVVLKRKLSIERKVEEIIKEKNNLPNDLEDILIELDKKKFSSILSLEFYEFIEDFYPEILFWRPSKEFLINETIDLNLFKENPEKISIPLKNIFNIYNKKTNSEIKNCIDNALKSPAKKDKLVEELSESITKYVNKIWKEHKIKIKISIDSTNCNVLIEDKDKKYSYFNMNQRSDGFKQFISLILSLSTLNENKSLVNKVILIDEPEVHLHPSGIVYMRDELLKIAKNNTILISTHSQFMIDTENANRHFIVNKIKGDTKITQVDNNTNFKEDTVLKNAFGLNLYKELLPQNIIVVEGKDDKETINHFLTKLTELKNYTIKSANGASKIPGYASLLASEDLTPLIIFDADKEGNDNKKRILENEKNHYNNSNVFTLRDILKTLPENSTIEDLYPKSFIKEKLFEEAEKNFNLNDNEAVIIQIKNQDSNYKSDKQKLESLKIKLSKSFIEKYSSKKELEKIAAILEFTNNLNEIIISKNSF